MADEKQSFNTLSVEDAGAVRMGKKINEYDNNNMFNFVTSHFAMFFLDLEELRKFISFLYDQKGEMLVDEMLKDFNVVMKEFRQQ
jgi:hypothetical protein